MCKIPWNCHAFLPLCGLIELSRFEKYILLRKNNTPIHQFSRYLHEKRDLTSLFSCQRFDNLLFRLKGCLVGRSGHFRCSGLGDSLDFWSWPLTGRHGRLPYACAKLRGTVEIVDPDKGKTYCHVRFMIFHMLMMYAHLILFSATPKACEFDVSFCWKNGLKNGFWSRES